MLANDRIANLLSEKLNKQEPCVMATVVSVEGSAYRREGSKMLIGCNGYFDGMISGGCLEADVVEEAKKVLEMNTPMVKKYILDEDLVWGLGLGCPGIVEILLEPALPNCDYWEKWVEQTRESNPFISCTIIQENEMHTSLIVTNNGIIGHWVDEPLQTKAVSIAREKLKERNPSSETIAVKGFASHDIRIYIDVFLPKPHLCIFGAGHDAIPVAQMSHHLGFRTTVIDGRDAFNTKERFPNAETILIQPKDMERTNLIQSSTFIVIMNHHLERDMDALALALKSQASYVGVLGPRKRRDKMLTSLRELGITFTKEELEKMHSPIGLDIGAVTPEEIALSIIAELVAIRKGHCGGSLKDRYTIHQHPMYEEQR